LIDGTWNAEAMNEAKNSNYGNLVYGDAWKAWRDPMPPECSNPTTYLLDKHQGTPTDDKIGLIVDEAGHSLSI
jgi:hypothetical protein